jgi:hypothetical protein
MRRKANLWKAAKSMLFATLVYTLVFEAYVQIWVLEAFSSGSTAYKHADGALQEMTMLEQVMSGILNARLSFPYAVVVSAAVTLAGTTILGASVRMRSSSVARSLVAGALIGGAVGFGIVVYLGAWRSDGLYAFVLASMAAGIVAIDTLRRGPNNSLEGDAWKPTRASGWC